MYRRGLTRRIPSGTLRARNAYVCAFGLHRGTAVRGPAWPPFFISERLVLLDLLQSRSPVIGASQSGQQS